MTLPVPDNQPSSSVPSRIVNGRTRVSRASSRASMSFRRKSMTAATLRISAPSEFRRVPTLSIPVEAEPFRPLELSFTHLPELPNFEEFSLDNDDIHPPVPLARPPKASLSRHSRTRSHRTSSSFHLPRKPVRSGSFRSSLATLEQPFEKPPPIPSNPLVPHFSSPSAVVSLNTRVSAPTQQPDSAPPLKSEPIKDPKNELPALSRAFTLQDRPLPPIPIEDDSSDLSSARREPRTPVTPPGNAHTNISNNTPPRSGRVAQWLLQTSNKGLFFPSGSITNPWKPSEKNPFRLRSRTLSGSTLASSITSLTSSLGFKTTPSEPVNTTTILHPSNIDGRMEKELEFPLSKPSMDNPYPTIHESQHQESDNFSFNYYENYRHSAVGLAF
ncbi:hypothetical protein EYZ11_001714 [Aspergillus tanneri]|nr:hypothetical protein EYZ11_001714 [Aspergillus tanneri]